MICNKCGVKIAEGKFCPKCGNRLEAEITKNNINIEAGSLESKGQNEENNFTSKLRGIMAKIKGFFGAIFSLACGVLVILMATGKLDKFAHEITGGAYGDPGERVIAESSTKESQNETTIYNEVNSQKEGYYYLGDTINFTNGLNIIVSDASVYTEGEDIYVYIDLQVENKGKEDCVFSYTQVAFYGDDYLLEQGFPIFDNAESLSIANISSGRKYSGRVYALCPNLESLSKIEVEIGDAVVLLMDVNATESKFICNDNDIKRSVTITESENGTMYISMSAYDIDNELQASFEGLLLTTLDGNYYVAQKDFLDESVVFKVVFEDTMKVTVEVTDDKKMYLLQGAYKLLY